MAQVIIFQNPSASNVCVCHPTGELDIQEVLTKDCPKGAIIVDESELPQGDDAKYFDAWVLKDGKILVDLDKAKDDKLLEYNNFAVTVAQKRQLNTLSGIENTPDDATWQSKLASDRNLISSATNTTELSLINNPS